MNQYTMATARFHGGRLSPDIRKMVSGLGPPFLAMSAAVQRQASAEHAAVQREWDRRKLDELGVGHIASMRFVPGALYTALGFRS